MKTFYTISVALLFSLSTAASTPPIVAPGPPGEVSTLLSEEAAIAVADTRHSADDVAFMQGMIPHHQQALEMSLLAETRTNSPDILEAAGRIKASQDDEISFMTQWLDSRGEAHHHTKAHEHTMQGMATPEQLSTLSASDGTDFDRQFLTLMIAHHEGALDMVEDLMEQPGAAYDPTLFEFINDLENDQDKEIERMHELLVALSDDPRANLSGGLHDAEEAIWHLRKVAVLTKPPGFFDPENPADLPATRFMGSPGADPEAKDLDVAIDEQTPIGHDTDQTAADITHAEHEHMADQHVSRKQLERAEDDHTEESSDSDGAAAEDDSGEKAKPESRAPLLSFSNTDIAFRDDIMVSGSYHGFNIYRLGDDGIPDLQASVVCPGGQGDVSIAGDLLIMSVEETRGRIDCGLNGVRDKISDERFRGLRIFDISDLSRPRQVGAVQTCRGSHTHSVVSGPGSEGKLIVYNSGISRVRDAEEMSGCFDESPGDDRTALFRIDVIEIPISNPAAARIIDSPTVFADAETGALAGLWRGGDHGDDTQETSRTDECHDITVFPSLNLAAGACSGNGILFDISAPRSPQRLDVATDTGFAYWHSATFNNDGSKVLFTDEWGGGSRPRCRAYDPLDWGADAIYDIVDGKLVFRAHYKMPAPQRETENCVAHNGSIVPVPGRDIFVQAWYQGGVSVIDFTDSSNPTEIAYFDRGPIDEEDLVTGGYWSTYWYRGHIYGTEITRGIDVFALTPSDFLTANEIAAAEVADQGGLFNPQQQYPVTWPAEPVVALAYLDQLIRARPELTETLAALYETLRLVDEKLKSGTPDASLAKSLQEWATVETFSAATALQASLRAISARLTDAPSVSPPSRLISKATP